MARERTGKERTLVELATAIDLGDKEISATKAVIQRKETEVWSHKNDLARYERERLGLLAEFCTRTGLVTRKAPAPDGMVAEGDPLTDDELKELDAKIAEAAEPAPGSAEEMPF